MADTATMTNIDAEDALYFTRPNTRIYTDKDITKLMGDEDNTESKILNWKTIERSAGRPGSAEFELLVEDEGGNANYVESIKWNALGVNPASQISDKIYCLIASDEDDGVKTPLFLGYFTNSSIAYSENEIRIGAMSVENLLLKKKITGKFAMASGTDYGFALNAPVIFNYEGRKDYEDGYFVFDDLEAADKNWTCWNMFSYVLNHIDNTLAGSCANNTDDTPEDLSDYFDTSKITATGAFGVAADAITINNVDITGMTYLDAMQEIIRHVGDYQLQFKIVENSGYKIQLSIDSTKAPTVKHTVRWGKRNNDITREMDFENATLSLLRDQKIRKVLVYGQPTIMQLCLCYPSAPIGASPLMSATSIEAQDMIKLSKDWDATAETNYIAAIGTDNESQAAYNSVFSLFKIDMSETDNNTNWVNKIPRTDARMSRIPYPAMQEIVVNSTLVTEDNTSANTKEQIYGWIYNGTAWQNIRDFGITVVLRSDRRGGIKVISNASKKAELKEALVDNSGYIVLVMAIELGDCVRGVAGLTSGDVITTTEADISADDDDQVLRISSDKYRNTINWYYVSEYDYVSKVWTFDSPDFHRDDRTAIGDYAKSVMTRMTQIDNSGLIGARGWRSEINGGDMIEKIDGQGRVVTLNLWADSVILDHDQYHTDIAVSQGIK